MKIRNFIFTALGGMVLAATLQGCEGEKDLIIIEDNLPIKTSALYMVGDATPNGWNIDDPTPFEATGEDPLVFTWEGSLNPGEMKLCLTTGSWDAPFIRPLSNGDPIGKEEITAAGFQMHAGDPDEKWRVTEQGTYRLTFDLRNWSMSSSYLGGSAPMPIEPIHAETVYLVGDATPAGWNIDSPTAMEKKSEYIFQYDGPLTAGEFKACTSAGSWDVNFIRPSSEGCAIGKDGVASNDFVYVANPDNKWRVTDAGIYRITLDLEHYTIEAERTGDISSEKEPIESATLYMIGDATPGGWSMDEATAYTRSAENRFIFTWEGELVEGNMKACLEPDGTFSCPFLRPSSADATISADGVSAPDFVYTKNPDDQWHVTRAGKYRITFDLEHYTIKAEYLNSGDTPSEKEPIETATLYMIGDATAGGWSMDNLTALTRSDDDPFIFTWEGDLKEGNMKACLQSDGTFSCPFLRPSSGDVIISADGVSAPDFVYTKDPDDQWHVTQAGKYRITFDLKNYTIKAEKL